MRLYISTAPRCADCGSLSPELVKDYRDALVCSDRISCEARQLLMQPASRMRPLGERVIGLRSSNAGYK